MTNPFDTPPAREPATVTAGDRVRWRRDDLADTYDAESGWTLSYALNGPNGAAASATVTADGNGWLAVLDASALVAGRWAWSLFASQAVFGRYTIDSGELDVRPDPAAPGAGYDPRSHARRVLDAINATIEGRASAADLKVTFADGRSIERIPHSELLTMRKHYARLVAGEDRKAKGIGPGRVLARL